MHGKQHRPVRGELRQGVEQLAQRRRIVHVGRAVQRRDGVLAPRDAVRARRCERPRRRDCRDEGIDHHVADEMDALRRQPFAAEILCRLPRGREQQAGDVIGY